MCERIPSLSPKRPGTLIIAQVGDHPRQFELHEREIALHSGSSEHRRTSIEAAGGIDDLVTTHDVWRSAAGIGQQAEDPPGMPEVVQAPVGECQCHGGARRACGRIEVTSRQVDLSQESVGLGKMFATAGGLQGINRVQEVSGSRIQVSLAEQRPTEIAERQRLLVSIPDLTQNGQGVVVVPHRDPEVTPQARQLAEVEKIACHAPAVTTLAIE